MLQCLSLQMRGKSAAFTCMRSKESDVHCLGSGIAEHSQLMSQKVKCYALDGG